MMNMKIMLSAFAASAVIALSSFTNSKNNEPAGKVYVMDQKATTATWVGKKIAGEHTGTLKISKGEVTASGTDVTAGNFEFDMTSITCTDIKEKKENDKLIGHLKSDDFFSVDKHPKATFVLTKATLKSGNDYDVTGKLTIKGITNDITFPAMIKVDDKTLVAVGKVNVDRTKYEIKYASASFFSSIGDKAIKDEFELNFNFVGKAK